MGAGVAADVVLLPAGGWTLCVMCAQARLVVLALVAEQVTEGRNPGAAADQTVPVVVSDLVPKVSQQRAVRFRHVPSVAFPFGIVGFGDVDGGQAGRVTRDDPSVLLECGWHPAAAGAIRLWSRNSAAISCPKAVHTKRRRRNDQINMGREAIRRFLP